MLSLVFMKNKILISFKNLDILLINHVILRKFSEIGEIAGAAEVTVKQTYKLLYPRAAELFPEDFKFTAGLESLPPS